MVQQFSWAQFFLATGAMSLLWYAGVGLLYFRNELENLIGRKTSTTGAQPLPHRWEKGVEELGEVDETDEGLLMGKTKLPEGMSLVGSEQISFASDDGDKVHKIGLVADVLQELKEVFAVLAKEDGNKKDFFGLMEMVRLNFPAIGGSPHIASINAFISEHAPFHLSPAELENLWD